MMPAFAGQSAVKPESRLSSQINAPFSPDAASCTLTLTETEQELTQSQAVKYMNNVKSKPRHTFMGTSSAVKNQIRESSDESADSHYGTLKLKDNNSISQMPWAKQDDINTAVRPERPSKGLFVSDKLKQSIKSIQRAIDRL